MVLLQFNYKLRIHCLCCFQPCLFLDQKFYSKRIMEPAPEIAARSLESIYDKGLRTTRLIIFSALLDMQPVEVAEQWWNVKYPHWHSALTVVRPEGTWRYLWDHCCHIPLAAEPATDNRTGWLTEHRMLLVWQTKAREERGWFLEQILVGPCILKDGTGALLLRVVAGQRFFRSGRR